MDIFTRSWKGEASLAAAFWLVYFLFGIILAIIVTLIFKVTVADFNYTQYQGIIAAVCFPYTLFSVICVWRCARNSSTLWRVLARIIVILAIIFGIYNLWAIAKGPYVVPPKTETNMAQQ